MKKAFITYLTLILIQSVVYSQNTGFTISDNGDFFQNGKKIGKVVKTTNSNLLTGTIPEFTVYDVNGVARFLFEKVEGKFIFLDDNKSFLPRKVDAYAKQVAQFFASDSILTPRGYNVAYRSAFIKKHKGFNFSDNTVRDFSAPIHYIENNILQGEALIGRYEYRLMENGKDALVAVYDLNNKKVAFVTTTKDNSVAYFDMKILDANQKEMKVFEKEFDTGQLYRKGIEWIVANGFLGSDKSVESKSNSPKPAVASPLYAIEVPTRFLEVRKSDLVWTRNKGIDERNQKVPIATELFVTVNTSLTKMAISTSEIFSVVFEGRGLDSTNFRSRIIDLNAGKIIETSETTLTNYLHGYSFIADVSDINGKRLGRKEKFYSACVKVDDTGRTTCFGKPPKGFNYSGQATDKYIIGFEYEKVDKEVCVFENINGETKVKYRLSIMGDAKFTVDGKKIYGTYQFKEKLWEEAEKISQSPIKDKKMQKRLIEIQNDPEYKKLKPFYTGIRIFDLETGLIEKEIELQEYATWPFVEILPDGRLFVKYIVSDNSKSIGKVDIYSLNGEILRTIEGLDSDLITGRSIIAGKSNHVLSISDVGIIKVFDINTGTLIAHINDSSPGKRLSTTYPIYLPVNEGFVLIPYKNQLISLFSIKELKVVANLFITADDWAILARDGRFDGSISALEKLEWREYNGDAITSRISVSSTFDGYYTPRLFNQLLTGEIDKVVAPVLSKQKIESLPKLAIATIDNQQLSKSTDGIVNFTTSKKNIAIDIQNTTGKKVKEVRLYNNGKLVGVQKGSNSTSYKFNVMLNSVLGETNAIYAVATTEMGVDSEKAKVVVTYTGSDSQPPKMYALIIGINEYQNPKYKLNYAYSDAESFQKQTAKLKSGLFKDVEVLMLSDKQASKLNIIEAFKSIGAKMKEQDVFLFYFAGHGTLGNIEGREEFFIVPYDVTQLYGNDAVLDEKAISAAELKIFSSQLNAQKQVFILDACNSAGALNAAATRGVAEEKAVAQLARSTGSYWLTAAGSEQYATEFEQLGHGVFTYSLLEAISGKSLSLTTDGVLTIRELSSFVEQRVPELSQQYKGKPQYPASFSVGNDFPLLVFTKEK